MTKFESSDVFIVFSNFVIKKISTTIVRGKFYKNYVYCKYWVSFLKEATIIHKIFETNSSFCAK